MYPLATPTIPAARLARSAAQLSAQVPVVVLIDDADDLDLDLALLLLENLTFRHGGKMLIVAAVDPDGPLATALRKGNRAAWQAGRVFAVDVDPDMGPQSRIALARELCPGLDDVLARQIGQRTATFKDVFAVAATTERAAELSAAGDEVGALTAIDAVIDAVMRGLDPSPAAVTVAWAGGVVHARQVARVLADAGQAELAADPDLARSSEGRGTVIRLADPASPRFKAAVARLEPQVRREMAAAVLQEAVTICADSAEPLVGRIAAGGVVHHVRRDLDGNKGSHLLLRVRRGLVADLEVAGDLAPAAKVAAEALRECPSGDHYEQDTLELETAVLRLASTQSAGEQDPLVARLIGKPIEPRNLVRSFKRVCGDNQIRPIRVHTLRHTTASLLKDLKVPTRDAQVILGHAHVSTTQQIYTHVDEAARRDALTRLNKLLGGE